MSEVDGAVVDHRCLSSWLDQWPWTHVAHLVFNRDKVAIDHAERSLKCWRLALIKGEGIQLASMGVLNHIPSSHLHVLLIGQSRTGKNLNDVSTGDWQKYTSLWKGDAKINSIYSDGILGYIEDMNTPSGHHELLKPYNLKLLKRLCE